MYQDFQSRLSGNGALDGFDNILKKIDDRQDIQLLKTMHRFNKACLKTNFYKEDVGAIGFRLDPR